jgi:hypothetical protein
VNAVERAAPPRPPVATPASPPDGGGPARPFALVVVLLGALFAVALRELLR